MIEVLIDRCVLLGNCLDNLLGDDSAKESGNGCERCAQSLVIDRHQLFNELHLGILDVLGHDFEYFVQSLALGLEVRMSQSDFVNDMQDL